MRFTPKESMSCLNPFFNIPKLLITCCSACHNYVAAEHINTTVKCSHTKRTRILNMPKHYPDCCPAQQFSISKVFMAVTALFNFSLI